MKTQQKARISRVERKKPGALPAWRKRWEKEYDEKLKSGRFLKEDGIC